MNKSCKSEKKTSAKKVRCDCESCDSFPIPDINKIIIEGALCRRCDNTLPPHTTERHLDKSDIIHTCPHSASQLLATEIRKEGK